MKSERNKARQREDQRRKEKRQRQMEGVKMRTRTRGGNKLGEISGNPHQITESRKTPFSLTKASDTGMHTVVASLLRWKHNAQKCVQVIFVRVG